MDGLRILLGPLVSIPLLFSTLTGLCTLILVCVFTRLSAASNVKKTLGKGEPELVSVVPYWIPWLGHTLSFAMGGQRFLAQCRKTTRGDAFAIILRGKRYTVFTAKNITRQLQESHCMRQNAEARMYKLHHFFGASSNGPRLQHTLDYQRNDRALFLGSSGVSNAEAYIAKVNQTLEMTVYNLISFNESWVDQSNWEKASKTIIRTGFDSFAEVSLFALIDSFMGELATTILMGKNFMENNNDTVEDLRIWDSKGTSFMNQVPAFLPQMSAAAVARQRVLRSLRRFRGTVSAYIAGDDIGSDWSDLSDVSPFIIARLERWKSEKHLPSGKDPDISADAALLWAFNKPNMLIAWLLHRVYSDASLLKEVREEVDQFVQVEQPKSELPIPEPPRVSIHAQKLMEKSVLLRAAMNETFRLHTNTITYGVMTKDLVVAVTQENASELGETTLKSYILRRGDLICLPHHHIVTATADAGSFTPDGFSSIANLKAPVVTAVNATPPDMFGTGDFTCPGRGIAEQEIMISCAAILSMWEVNPSSGAWSLPDQKPGLCAMLPVKDLRVNISRRKGEWDE